jgi:murein L,D-transpeptidase YafK
MPPTLPKPKPTPSKPTAEISPSAQTTVPVTILTVNDPLDPKADDDPSLTLTKKVLDWAEAWSGKDFDSYSDFYSEVFQTTRFKSKSQWLDYRKPRIVGKRSISVEIRNLVVKVLEGGRAEAVFEQNYEAGNLKVRSAKRLQFIREGSNWRILWEGN